MNASVRQIQRRILLLVLRAFGIVVFITLILFLVITGIAVARLAQTNPVNQTPLISLLKGYYIGHNGWQGIDALFVVTSSDDMTRQAAYLLDAQGLVLIDHGKNNTGLVGRPYPPNPNDFVIELQANGQKIGTLILDETTIPSRVGLIFGTLFPVALASLSLALLTIILGLLLIRRIVTPLAEVIAGAQAVTAGNLEARVQVQGPQDLRALSDSFNQMAIALERNDRERRDLLADIAHELRTPIMAVRSRLECILDGVYPMDEHQLNLVLKANYLLEHLLEDLRLLTLAETRQLHFDKKYVDICALCQHMLDLLDADAQEKGTSLTLQYNDSHAKAFVDSQRIEQVISNLVGNALRYVPAGGKVWLNVENASDRIILSVNDNGPGVPEADLPYIFNRFWRKDKSRSRTSGGTGLGLAIARQLIEAQGGSISAHNLPGGGLQISIVLQHQVD